MTDREPIDRVESAPGQNAPGQDAPGESAASPPAEQPAEQPSQPAATSAPLIGAEAPLTRRRFLTYLVAITGAVGVGGLAAPFIRYAYPVQETQVEPKLEVGTVTQLTPLGEAIEFDYQERPAAMIMLEDGTIKAFSRICTHFGCIVDWLPEDEIFHCPCHAGVFAPDGTVVSGPPPAPLVEFNVVQEGDVLFVEGTV